MTHISGLAESGEIVTVQVTAPRSQAANPAFDVTPARLITGLMTERGIASASREGLAQLYSEKRPTMLPRRRRAFAEAVVAAAQKMQALGLSPGRSGNISVRWKDGMLITASGIRPEDLHVGGDIVFVDGAGAWAADATAPSSEWRFHKAIYDARPGVGAVVHCHSRYATALACVHLPIPAFHYMVAKAGGVDIPLAPYATYGTPELAEHAAAALANRNACLLANHGQIAIGETLEDALELAEEVEALAAQYTVARSLAKPALLPADEMQRVAEKFKTYGKAANPPTGWRSRS